MYQFKKIMITISFLTLLYASGCSGGNIEPSNIVSDTTENSEVVESSSETDQDESSLYDKHASMGLVAPREVIDPNIKWQIKNYVDEFGDETYRKYINLVGTGSFSNSATTNSDLIYSFIYDHSDKIQIKLFEYGNNLVNNSFSDDEQYRVLVKDSDGVKYEYIGYMAGSGGDRVQIKSYELLDLMRKNQTLKFYLENTHYTTSTYNFSVDTYGFETMFKNL